MLPEFKDVQSATPPIFRFSKEYASPTPVLVEDADDIRHFRRIAFTAFMAQVRNAGYRRMHVFPAMPLSPAVEFGRQLLPKADPTIGVWDFQDGRFVPTLQLQI
ncbi:SAVED domain-containing protein [Ramlibacter sp. 2FC]|uniref:SAVED domain-containing protein n=1 Tax=Ramlibacter sp. 2FC TaxID=2502188 RepID=UPI0014852BC9|nr:SAVED domain-containing protein [Ramlibacter sp. 2FC]